MSTKSKIVIGIAGASGSGKSTLAKQWAHELGAGELLCFDDYYHSIRPDEDASTKNFDHPAALDVDLFAKHLKALKQGEAIERPCYDFASHKRAGLQDVCSGG